MDELQKTAVDCNRGLYIHNEYNWARDEILRNIGKYTKRAELFAASRKSLIKLFISLIFKFFLNKSTSFVILRIWYIIEQPSHN